MIRQLIDLMRQLIRRLLRARSRMVVFEHAGATAEDGIGAIPAARTIAEIAHDGARPIDELAALVETWNTIDYRARDLAAEKAGSLRGKEIEVHLADGGDTMLDRALSRLERDGRAAVEYLRVAAHARGETWAGHAWTRADWLIAEHGYERPEDLRQKAARPASVDDTREMTPAERRALRRRLSRKAARR